MANIIVIVIVIIIIVILNMYFHPQFEQFYM